MYTLTKEQVNELANGKSIKDVLPEAFKLEVGKWYKCPELGEAIFFVTDIQGSDFKAYGLNYRGEWTSEDDWIGEVYAPTEPATPEEVESMLIAEAKKRGYVKGANVKGVGDFTCSGVLSLGNCLGSDSGYKFIENKLVANISTHRNAVIFENGKWATIVTETKEDILNELIDYAEQTCNQYLKNKLKKLL